MKFGDVEDAFLFVGSGAPFEHTALICRDTGQTYYRSELGDLDELPDDVDEHPQKYVAVPHKNELELGKTLVLAFTAEYLPENVGTVDRIFRSRGAYARFKDLLDGKGLLEKWYEYEDARQETAIREWCIREGIVLED